jgi:hypothetical protein
MKLQNTIVAEHDDTKERDFEIITEVLLKDLTWRRVVNNSRRFGGT